MNFLVNVLQLNIIAGVLIIVLWILEKKFDIKSGHFWRKWFWGILCLRFFVPIPLYPEYFHVAWKGVVLEVNIPEEYSKANISQNVKTGLILDEEMEDTVSYVESEYMHVFEETNGLDMETFRVSFSDAIFCVWAIVFLILVRFQVSQYLYMRRLYLESAVICEEPEIHHMVCQIGKEYRLGYLPGIMVQNRIKSPMLFGYLRSCLLITDSYTLRDLEMVVRHELMHAKHRDLWYKLLVVVVCDVYWFNPVLLYMKKMAFQDVEFVCDERVTKYMTSDERKVYGNVILKTVNGAEPKNVPLSTQFAANKIVIKKRIGNLFTVIDYKKGTCFFLLLTMLFGFLTLGIKITTKTKDILDTVSFTESEAIKKETYELPAQFNEQKSMLERNKQFDLRDQYIVNLIESNAHYKIDDNQVLWGYGYNEYGKLGYPADYELTEQPCKIAEGVIHVDASPYFTIYLTEKGQLYGMGANMNGLMGLPVIGGDNYMSNIERSTTESPVLIMEHVVYARCGIQSITILKEDGTVWFSGQFESGIRVANAGQSRKILEDVKYIDSGYFHAGALKEDGTLWMWGNNMDGACGIDMNYEYIIEPVKVLDHVELFWVDEIEEQSNYDNILNIDMPQREHRQNTLVILDDGTISGCGKGFSMKGEWMAIK